MTRPVTGSSQLGRSPVHGWRSPRQRGRDGRANPGVFEPPVDQMQAIDVAPPGEIPVVSLHWLSSRPEIGGIDQSYDPIAANAVDLVVSRLNGNETGAPEIPRMLLFAGRWVEPVVAGVR